MLSVEKSVKYLSNKVDGSVNSTYVCDEEVNL